MKRSYTCILCPNGCALEALVEEGRVQSVTGQLCPRGEAYVRQEVTDPRRTIASSVLVRGGTLPLASVRLTAPIPKGMIFPVMQAIRQVELQAPVQAGTVVLRRVCGLDSDVVVTRSVPAR